MVTPKNVDFEARAKDWRNGAIVYQVFVDRFAPSTRLNEKLKYYPTPAKVMKWTDKPVSGKFSKEAGCYTHEMHFWGGDLQSLSGKLDYVSKLGADVLYLLPIHLAKTNHKYDATDFLKIDPQYGTKSELTKLISQVHKKKMKIMLDGVFNHMGQSSPQFQDALKSSKSKYRDWYYFGKNYSNGYKGFSGIANLPSINLDNPEVQRYLWKGEQSVVKKFLNDGIDGWRLDVAFDLGPAILESITKSAHRAKPGSSVVGEISGYPAEWDRAVDGVFNFTPYQILRGMLDGRLSGTRAGRIINQMVDDAGIENLLKSWLIMDNHDTSRLASDLPDFEDRKLAQLLTMTLPGSPVIYYGSELGMAGVGDPGSRAAMQWELVSESNRDLSWVKKLISIRKSHPALKVGDCKSLESDKSLAFARVTDKLFESVIVIVNPLNQKVEETFATRIGRIMSWGPMIDLLSGQKLRSVNGMLTVSLAPKGAMILVPEKLDLGGYSPYDRIGK